LPSSRNLQNSAGAQRLAASPDFHAGNLTLGNSLPLCFNLNRRILIYPSKTLHLSEGVWVNQTPPIHLKSDDPYSRTKQNGTVQ
jgi:hypothetical protein